MTDWIIAIATAVNAGVAALMWSAMRASNKLTSRSLELTYEPNLSLTIDGLVPDVSPGMAVDSTIFNDGGGPAILRRVISTVYLNDLRAEPQIHETALSIPARRSKQLRLAMADQTSWQAMSQKRSNFRIKVELTYESTIGKIKTCTIAARYDFDRSHFFDIPDAE